MAIWNRSLEVTQDQDYTFTLGYAMADPSGQLSLSIPYNFTGCTAALSVYSTSDVTSTNYFTLTGTYGTTGTAPCINFGVGFVGVVNVGNIIILLDHATTASLPSGELYYDLLVRNGNQNTYYAAGPFIVTPSVTR